MGVTGGTGVVAPSFGCPTKVLDGTEVTGVIVLVGAGIGAAGINAGITFNGTGVTILVGAAIAVGVITVLVGTTVVFTGTGVAAAGIGTGGVIVVTVLVCAVVVGVVAVTTSVGAEIIVAAGTGITFAGTDVTFSTGAIFEIVVLPIGTSGTTVKLRLIQLKLTTNKITNTHINHPLRSSVSFRL